MCRSFDRFIIRLAVVVPVVGCTASPVPFQQAAVPAIHGYVEHASRRVQADITDIANGATVSLIDASSGQTYATTVTQPSGSFSLTFPGGFRPISGNPYFLEAAKGLPVGLAANRAGAPLARVRTLLVYQGGAWLTLSNGAPGGVISLGAATTALSAIAGLRGLSTPAQVALLGRLQGTSFTDAGSAIAPGEYALVFNLVQQALANDQDPLEVLGYDASAATPYFLRAPSVELDDSVLAAASPGGVVTFYGANLPASASVTVAGLAPATWSVSADRSRLTMTLPPNAVSGQLQLSSGQTTWFGPFLPVSGTVGTFAGSGYAFNLDGMGTGAGFAPHAQWYSGLAFDTSGNLFVADRDNKLVRRVTRAGRVSTFAGQGYPDSSDAFASPTGIAVDPSGNVYLASAGDNAIFKLDPTGHATTLPIPGLNGPQGLALDASGRLYAADYGNQHVIRIDPGNVVSIVAGSTAGSADGVGAAAQFNGPVGLALDSAGNIYVADSNNNRIRRISPGGTVTTLLSAGATTAWGNQSGGTPCSFNTPQGLALDTAGNLYIPYQNQIAKLTTGGSLTNLTGAAASGYVDAPIASALFNWPQGVALDSNNRLYAVDSGNYVIRVLVP